MTRRVFVALELKLVAIHFQSCGYPFSYYGANDPVDPVIPSKTFLSECSSYEKVGRMIFQLHELK
jgi:hypothetical protein